MLNKIFTLMAALLVFGCTSNHNSGDDKFRNALSKKASGLNTVYEAELETRASNQSDESNFPRAALFLTDYDKSANQPIFVIDGEFENNNTEFTPYINEHCPAIGVCGVMPIDASSLEEITIDMAVSEMNRVGLKNADDMNKDEFKNGKIFLVHSEIREKDKGPLWVITVAVEVKDFKKSAKYVKIRYKVLQYKLKDYSA